MNIRADIAAEFNAVAQKAGWTVTGHGCGHFDSAKLRRLHDTWRKTAGERLMPAKTDFTARSLATLLRHITFIESEGERFRFRFFGSALAHVSGDHTGRYIDEVVPPAHWPSWHAAYSMVLDTATPLRFVSHYQIPWMAHLRGESYLAPLSDDTGRPGSLLSASIFGPR